MAYRDLKNAKGEIIGQQYVPNGWKITQKNDLPTYPKRVNRKVMQEIYLGRRYNLMNNNNWPAEHEAQFRRWVMGFMSLH
jgi:hypothetical protein